jgi:predicted ArsR family transcriptional regulator
VKNNRSSNPYPRKGFGPKPTARARGRVAHLSAARARILDVLTDQPEPCTVSSLTALTRQHPNTIREHLDGLVDDRLVTRTRAPAHGRGRPAWLYSAATDVGSEPGTREYAALASALAAQIARSSRQPFADSVEAGRQWGRELVRRSTANLAANGAAGESERQIGAVTGDPARVTTTIALTAIALTAIAPTTIAPTPIAPTAIAARRQVVSLLEELGFSPSADARAAIVKLRRCPLLEAANQYPDVVCGVHLGVVRGALGELGVDPDRTEQTALQPFSEPGACRLELLPRATKVAT